jgi:hypothetical protein
MKVKAKLALLELIGGIFGWAWLIAGAVAIVSLVGAIFFGWPWSRFFWAFGISFVGKTLLRGFNAHQARVHLEARQRGDL